MKIDIIPIGNSKGIRIPKAMLEQCGFVESVEIELHDQTIVLRPSHLPRQGWQKAFATKAKAKDDAALDAYQATYFDESEWEW